MEIDLYKLISGFGFVVFTMGSFFGFWWLVFAFIFKDESLRFWEKGDDAD